MNFFVKLAVLVSWKSLWIYEFLIVYIIRAQKESVCDSAVFSQASQDEKLIQLEKEKDALIQKEVKINYKI